MGVWNAPGQVGSGLIEAREVVRELLPVFEELAERHYTRLDHLDGESALRTAGRRFVSALRAVLDEGALRATVRSPS